MKTIALYNLKGGVGKTASAVNLAYLASQRPAPTLLWDLDPQGAASFYFRVQAELPPGAALIQGEHELDPLIRGSDFDYLDILPADFGVRDMELGLGDVERPRKQLRRLLRPLRDHYEYVFLDCAPSISRLSEGVFSAADVLLLPTIPTALSLRTLAQVMAYLKQRKGRRPLALPFFTLVDSRKSLHRNVCAWADEQELGFLRTRIPYSSLVERMGAKRAPLPSYAPKSPAAKAYAALWEEIEGRIGAADSSSPLLKKRARNMLVDVAKEEPEAIRARLTPPDPVDASSADSGAQGREIEFKFRLSNEDDFKAVQKTLRKRCSKAGRPVRQVNHFFDTPSGDLHKAGLVLRLREEAGRFLVTAKGGEVALSADRTLTAKSEEEIQVDDKLARALLDGMGSPLETLTSELGSKNALLTRIRTTLDGRQLEPVGSFENHRTRLGPLTLDAEGVDLAVIFELDRTRFPGNRFEYEVEVEVTSESSAEAARSALSRLLLSAGVTWSSAASKAKRFFAALAEDEGPPRK